jgi:hypothetical protein
MLIRLKGLFEKESTFIKIEKESAIEKSPFPTHAESASYLSLDNHSLNELSTFDFQMASSTNSKMPISRPR